MGKQTAIVTAKAWLEKDPIFLDTETTSFKGQALEISIVDKDGNILFDKLIKALFPIEDGAKAVHKIDESMLEDKPLFEEVWDELDKVLRGKLVLIYNSQFDTAVLQRSGYDRNGEPIDGLFHRVMDTCYSCEYGCVMKLFSQYLGTERWQKLEVAANHFGIENDTAYHRALGDAEMARKVFLAIVNSEG